VKRHFHDCESVRCGGLLLTYFVIACVLLCFRYRKLSPEQLDKSRAESLKDTAERIMPFFNSVIAPSLRSGNKCLIVSHANTIRTLIKQLDGISDEDIKGMSIPTGIPLLYRLDKNLKPVDPVRELEFRYMVEPKG
jgi:bisphosphoglycerate-dependent phosphoglycerate mutase family 1